MIIAQTTPRLDFLSLLCLFILPQLSGEMVFRAVDFRMTKGEFAFGLSRPRFLIGLIPTGAWHLMHPLLLIPFSVIISPYVRQQGREQKDASS